MRQINQLLFCCFFLSVFSSPGFAQDSINVVTTAVPMLRISPDARAGGMGDVGIASTPDANASFWNQAKIPFATQKSAIAVTYTPWLKDLGLNDVYLISAAGYHQITEDQALSGSLRYFSLGNIQFTDFAGNDLQRFTPREWAFDAGYSRRLSDKIGVGVALRFIYSNLGNGTFQGTPLKPGTAVAGDLSFFYDGRNETGKGLTAGAVMSNLGSKITYTQDANAKDYIPANLGLGVMYHAVIDETSKLSFGMDINKLMVPTPPGRVRTPEEIAAYRNKNVVGSWFSSFGDAPGGFGEEMREFQVSVGAEYSYNDLFFARAGYFYEDKTKGNRRFFSLGAGIKYNKLGFNFSYLVPTGQGINRNPLSNTTRFSLLFDLGGDGDE
ncbi:type IX secretion system outer membrane channel protein PorV [Lacibacter sp. MH-610]|uniref:type IX secretion system outer membrane channel protein PorV n=1 Tax=Lacibacter sp. MH-610 TaxID=3020883 RepID=UPI00389141AF